MVIRNIFFVVSVMPEQTPSAKTKLSIDRLGAMADGEGRVDGQLIYVPYTLPGEEVEIATNGSKPQLVNVVKPSPHRITPVCRHYQTCGGCALQHLADEEVLRWKQEQVQTAFDREKVKVQVQSCVPCHDRSRRRASFALSKTRNTVALGFHRKNSDEVVDIEQCPVLVSQLESQFEPFKALAATILRGDAPATLTVNMCDNGLDLDFQLALAPTETMLAAFVKLFTKTGFCRASINSEIIASQTAPIIQKSGYEITPPPGGFLQAVEQAEQALGDKVSKHLASCKKVADLFSGCGTFSVRLAARSAVHAVEGQQTAIDALKQAKPPAGNKPITCECRDLDSLPLTRQELKRFDGICLDPPRAGALPQIQQIAKSDVKKIAYVSCNPKTLARDVAVLVDAGFKLDLVQPVDQFKYSTHVEVVALISRAKSGKKRSIFG